MLVSTRKRHGHGHRDGHGDRVCPDGGIQQARVNAGVEPADEGTRADALSEPAEAEPAETGPAETEIAGAPAKTGAGSANDGPRHVATAVGVLRVELARQPGETKQDQHARTQGQESSEYGQAPFRAGEGSQSEQGWHFRCPSSA
jgi:hypothetical protein